MGMGCTSPGWPFSEDVEGRDEDMQYSPWEEVTSIVYQRHRRTEGAEAGIRVAKFSK